MTTKVEIPQTEDKITLDDGGEIDARGGQIGGLVFKTLSAAGVAAAGPVTLAGAAVGDRLLSVFGALTAGGPLLAKAVGTDFEATVSVTGQVQQLAAADLSLSTFVFLLEPKLA